MKSAFKVLSVVTVAALLALPAAAGPYLDLLEQTARHAQTRGATMQRNALLSRYSAEQIATWEAQGWPIRRGLFGPYVNIMALAEMCDSGTPCESGTMLNLFVSTFTYSLSEDTRDSGDGGGLD